MKKLFFSVLLMGTVITVAAQEVTVYKVNNPNGTSTTVTNVPPHIRTAFESAYPGETIIAWEEVNTWWRGSYNRDNRVTYVYYNEALKDYKVALPVIQNNVPEDVVVVAMKVHGPALYGISRMKSADNTDIYQVRLMENGTTNIKWMDATGAVVTNMFRQKTEVATTVNQ